MEAALDRQDKIEEQVSTRPQGPEEYEDLTGLLDETLFVSSLSARRRDSRDPVRPRMETFIPALAHTDFPTRLLQHLLQAAYTAPPTFTHLSF